MKYKNENKYIRIGWLMTEGLDNMDIFFLKSLKKLIIHNNI